MAEAWIDETLPPVISSLTTQHSFKSQFSALTTNADRVQFCLAQKEVQHWVGLFVSNFVAKSNHQKCSTTAGKFRKKGNDHFEVHKYESAIQLDSRAICFAPQIGVERTVSVSLALSYSNRSAAYYHLAQYDNALQDMNDALTFGYGQLKSQTKLQLLKCDCLIRLGRAQEAEQFLNSLQRKLTDDEDDTKCWTQCRISLDNDKKKDDSNAKASAVSLIEKL